MNTEDRAKPAFWTKKIYSWMLGFGVAGGGVAAFAWGMRQGVFALVGMGILAAGFRISELLIGVLTRVRAANGVAIGLLLAFKLLWWGGIFFLSRVITPGDLPGLAVGFGAFLLTLTAQGVVALGAPKLSAPRKD